MQYDIPVEVTEKQYNLMMNHCRGLVAGRVSDDGKYYIKAWLEIAYCNEFLKSIQ